MRVLAVAAIAGALSCAAEAAGPPVSPRDALRAVDAGVDAACRGLAQQLAARSGADAERIVSATCAAEGFTRSFRELLLSQQIEAAKRAGVAVPDINSAELEDAAADAVPAE